MDASGILESLFQTKLHDGATDLGEDATPARSPPIWDYKSSCPLCPVWPVWQTFDFAHMREDLGNEMRFVRGDQTRCCNQFAVFKPKNIGSIRCVELIELTAFRACGPPFFLMNIDFVTPAQIGVPFCVIERAVLMRHYMRFDHLAPPIFWRKMSETLRQIRYQI
ncbi:hypothetical protein X737_33395 [Mesorhizobium sp. L48C026A00]|nr:hypothetical protein X737_33395 [Mesorhizobium sp. L48C026A00]